MALILYKWFLLSWTTLLSYSAPYNNLPVSESHPFYLSVTEINHNAANKSLEISCKMFADDIESILEKNYRTTLDITTEKDKPQFDRLIPDYFNKHLSLTVDGRPVKFSFVGFENDKESVYAYFEVVQVNAIKKMDVNNSILCDFNNEQINIVHVTVNGNRKSNKQVCPASLSSFSF
ncbi:MAG: DUF6702 family protein [Flavisolibacter sp.]